MKPLTNQFRHHAHQLAATLNTAVADPDLVIDAIARADKWQATLSSDTQSMVELFTTTPVDKIDKALDTAITIARRREALKPYTPTDWVTRAVERCFDDYLAQLRQVVDAYARTAIDLAPNVPTSDFQDAARHGYGRELVNYTEAVGIVAEYGKLLGAAAPSLDRINHPSLPAWYGLVNPGKIPLARFDRVRRRRLDTGPDAEHADLAFELVTKIGDPAELIRRALHDDRLTVVVPATVDQATATLAKWAHAHEIQTSVEVGPQYNQTATR